MTDGYSICFIFNNVTGRNMNDLPNPAEPVPLVEPVVTAEEPPLSMIHLVHETINMAQLKRKRDSEKAKFKKKKPPAPKKLTPRESADKRLEDLKNFIQAIGSSRNDKIYGLDPGKRDLITAVAGLGREDYATISLSANEFYHNAGHHKCTKKR
jgi:hypothetical protein